MDRAIDLAWIVPIKKRRPLVVHVRTASSAPLQVILLWPHRHTCPASDQQTTHAVRDADRLCFTSRAHMESTRIAENSAAAGGTCPRVVAAHQWLPVHMPAHMHGPSSITVHVQMGSAALMPRILREPVWVAYLRSGQREPLWPEHHRG